MATTEGTEMLFRAGAVHLVLEGSSHDTFNDAVMLVALRFKGAMNYVRSFKKVENWSLFHILAGKKDTVGRSASASCLKMAFMGI